MNRPHTPQQFILDQETADEDELLQADHNSQSSQTESLLLHHQSNEHRYPPVEVTTKEGGIDDSSDELEPPTHHQPSHPYSHSTTIQIPTRSAVNLARSNPKPRARHPRTIVFGLLGLFGFAYLSTQLLALGTRFGGKPKVQVILMISDGMGPASETFARSYLRYLHETNSTTTTTTTTTAGRRSMLNESVWAGLEKEFWTGRGETPLDGMLVGTSKTRSSNSFITDSAAGATAFSCLQKTYNSAIGVTSSRRPCGTILESAKRQGFSTGIVTTSRLTHATPASFYAHVVDRDREDEIAEFLVGDVEGFKRGLVVDLALGGGKCFFVPAAAADQGSNDTISGERQRSDFCRRKDGKDLLEIVRNRKGKKGGIRVIEGMKGLRDWKDEEVEKGGDGDGVVIGLFSDDHMDYEIDRQRNTVLANEQPSLKEMATHALRYLKRKGEKGKGFFLMIEGARIDMAAHNNDPIAHLSDILAYYETVQFLKTWVDNENDQGTPTLLISTSDHETGGLALGRQLGEEYPEYLWYPEVLKDATHSTSYLGSLVASRYPSTTRDWVISEIYEKGLGITDVEGWEVDQLWMNRTEAYKVNRVLADAISRRAQIAWSTSGHSGVDVNLYSYGHNSTGLTGCVENTEVGEFVAHTMGLNLDVVTLELNKDLSSWFNDTTPTTTNTTTYRHYHGDF